MPSGLVLAARRVSPLVFFGLLPTVVLCPLWAPWTMIDFATFWRAGGRVVAGESPYPRVEPEVLATGLNFVYPALAAFAIAPFSLLPFAPAAALWAVASIAATAGALAVAGVRDRRCVGLAFLSPWVLNGAWVGAVTPLLVLGLALAWRYRDRRAVVAVALGALVVSKLFLWPLLIWLVATRRTRAALAAAVGGMVVTLAAWSALGFAGLADYPLMLRVLAEVEQDRTYSVTALGLSAGLSSHAAQLMSFAFGGVALLATAVVGRRRDGDLLALTTALAAAFVLSPIVWPHYFALVLVPLAVARPRCGPLWLATLLPWLVTGESDGALWKIAVGLGIAIGVLALARRQPAAAPVGEALAPA